MLTSTQILSRLTEISLDRRIILDPKRRRSGLRELIAAIGGAR